MTDGIKAARVGPNLWIVHKDVPPHRIYVKDGAFCLELITACVGMHAPKVHWVDDPHPGPMEVQIPLKDCRE